MEAIKNNKVLEAMRLLDLIDRTNNAIERQKQRTEPSDLELNQYKDLRQQYAGELDTLLQKFGFRIDMSQVA